jgi:hypothetical protein
MLARGGETIGLEGIIIKFLVPDQGRGLRCFAGMTFLSVEI